MNLLRFRRHRPAGRSSIYERWGRLDAFLGNAGVLGQLTPLAHLEPKTFQEVLEVNVTANWRLIRSLDPLLRLSDAGRVLFVTSGAARKHVAYWGATYALDQRSRRAGDHGADLLPVECETTAIKVNLINPGPMRTLMRKKAMPGEDPAYLVKPEDMAFRVVEMLSPNYDRNETIINFQK